MLGFIVLVAVSIHLAPQLTRRDIFFGVTVSPGLRWACRAIRPHRPTVRLSLLTAEGLFAVEGNDLLRVFTRG